MARASKKARRKCQQAIAFKKQLIEALRNAGVPENKSFWGEGTDALLVMVVDNNIAFCGDTPSKYSDISIVKANLAKRQNRKQHAVRKGKSSGKTFYDSDDWKRLRYQALVRHGAACQCCGATRSDGVKLHVDHIKPRSKYPELELNLDNLQILCEPCNMGKSARDETDWRNQPSGLGMVIWAG